MDLFRGVLSAPAVAVSGPACSLPLASTLMVITAFYSIRGVLSAPAVAIFCPVGTTTMGTTMPSIRGVRSAPAVMLSCPAGITLELPLAQATQYKETGVPLGPLFSVTRMAPHYHQNDTETLASPTIHTEVTTSAGSQIKRTPTPAGKAMYQAMPHHTTQLWAQVQQPTYGRMGMTQYSQSRRTSTSETTFRSRRTTSYATLRYTLEQCLMHRHRQHRRYAWGHTRSYHGPQVL